MANNTAKNPWILDTASATPVTTKPVRIRKLRWVTLALGVATDNLLVLDGNAREAIRFINAAESAGFQYEVDFSGGGPGAPPGLMMDGFTLTVIARGVLHVYLY